MGVGGDAGLVLLGPFAPDDEVGLAVLGWDDVGPGEGAEFGDAQAGAVERADDGLGAWPFGVSDAGMDFALAEHLRMAAVGRARGLSMMAGLTRR